MFAVPGWSVSSSALKQQAQPAAQTQNQSKEANGSKPDFKNNKRKRDDNVTKSNVGEMYRRIIEGDKKSSKQKQGPTKAEKKRKQKEKSEGNDDGSKQEAAEEQSKEEVDGGDKPSKKQKRNRKNKQQGQSQESTATPGAPAPPMTGANLTPLQQAMRQKLISSRFRHLNETLYTTPSEKALELFTANPELFDEYHAGFSRQVKESWPSNPVDAYIATIRARSKKGPSKKGAKPGGSLLLPRRPNGHCTIADLGCGDAQLARGLLPSAKKLDLKLLSYDLHAPKDSPITKADISNLPAEDGSVDVAIFCLSLMGTNWVSFVEEAWRVLRGDGKGECWVSEVKSRFGKVTRKKAQIGARKPLTKAEKKKQKKKLAGEDDGDSDADENDIFAEDSQPKNDDETDISAFVEVFRSRGFILKQESVDKSNKMFVKMEFIKQGGAPQKGKHASVMPARAAPGKKRFIEKPMDASNSMTPEEESAVLKPCVYKIR